MNRFTMSQQGVIKRYTLIIEKVRNGRYPSKKEIADHLNEYGFDLSLRTIDRDIEQIRYEFGIELVYDREKRGYRIDRENSPDISTFLKFLEIANTAEFIQTSLKESKESLKYISFAADNNLKGLEYLKDILYAIRERRIIEYDYRRFQNQKSRHHIIEPYLLREYLNRWYVIGKLNGTDDFRTYGIDRISDLKIPDKTFIYNEDENPSVFFQNVIGLNYTENVIHDVILSFSPEQADYVKTLPLHQTQEVLIDNEHEFRVRFQIIPNFEFEQVILMHAERVKVIEPEWLAKKIKKRLSKAASNYK
jgi:proteasome accessory factor B